MAWADDCNSTSIPSLPSGPHPSLSQSSNPLKSFTSGYLSSSYSEWDEERDIIKWLDFCCVFEQTLRDSEDQLVEASGGLDTSLNFWPMPSTCKWCLKCSFCSVSSQSGTGNWETCTNYYLSLSNLFDCYLQSLDWWLRHLYCEGLVSMNGHKHGNWELLHYNYNNGGLYARELCRHWLNCWDGTSTTII